MASKYFCTKLIFYTIFIENKEKDMSSGFAKMEKFQQLFKKMSQEFLAMLVNFSKVSNRVRTRIES